MWDQTCFQLDQPNKNYGSSARAWLVFRDWLFILSYRKMLINHFNTNSAWKGSQKINAKVAISDFQANNKQKVSLGIFTDMSNQD